eukprot:2356827-Pyramimonas_sp.AAC.1
MSYCLMTVAMASRIDKFRIVQPSRVQKYAVIIMRPPFWPAEHQPAATRPDEPGGEISKVFMPSRCVRPTFLGTKKPTPLDGRPPGPLTAGTKAAV